MWDDDVISGAVQFILVATQHRTKTTVRRVRQVRAMTITTQLSIIRIRSFFFFFPFKKTTKNNQNKAKKKIKFYFSSSNSALRKKKIIEHNWKKTTWTKSAGDGIFDIKWLKYIWWWWVWKFQRNGLIVEFFLLCWLSWFCLFAAFFCGPCWLTGWLSHWNFDLVIGWFVWCLLTLWVRLVQCQAAALIGSSRIKAVRVKGEVELRVKE